MQETLYLVMRLIEGNIIIYGTDDEPYLPYGSIGLAFIFDDYKKALAFADRAENIDILPVVMKDKKSG